MRLVGVSLAAMLVGGAAFAAPPDKLNITPEEHAACDGDAENLCAASYPDEGKLVACMKDKRLQLSPACATAFTAGLKRRHMPL